MVWCFWLVTGKLIVASMEAHSWLNGVRVCVEYAYVVGYSLGHRVVLGVRNRVSVGLYSSLPLK